jgi:type I restriction enzyme, S subunit
MAANPTGTKPMSFHRYDSYRDSGVEWLGEVPGHWGVVPFWSRFTREKRLGFPNEQLLSVYRDYGVIRKADRDDNFNKPSDDLGAYQLVEPGDLAFNKMKAWQGSVGISRYTGIVSPAYFVFRPKTKMNSEYFHYLLRSNPFACGYMTISKGIRINQWDVDPEQLAKVPLLLPTPEEQTAIAAFLDRETGKIDGLIEEQRRLVVLLKEKRQAVISHAVTKGLNPTAPLKPSGIDWLGDVPAHWGLDRFSRLVTIAEGQVDPRIEPYSSMILVAPNHIESRTGRLLGWESALDQGADSGKYLAPAGSVVYSKIRPSLAKATLVETEVICSADMYPLNGNNGLLNIYLIWLILSPGFTDWATLESDRVAMPKINRESLNALWLPVPPIDEQTHIASHISSIASGFDELLVETQSAITLLQERRAALISAAVTGKIDVRGAVKAQPKLSLIQGGLEANPPPASQSPATRERVRFLVASQILERLASKPAFGRTQLQKHLHLAQYHLDIAQIDGAYERKAAGPLDQMLLNQVEAMIEHDGFADITQETTGRRAVTYHLKPNRKSKNAEWLALVGHQKASALTSLLDNMADFSTQSAEAVSTLYAVWNDFLIDGNPPTDEELFYEIETNWHPEKSIPSAVMIDMLDWMRRKSVVPQGRGTKTIPTMTGSLI